MAGAVERINRSVASPSLYGLAFRVELEFLPFLLRRYADAFELSRKIVNRRAPAEFANEHEVMLVQYVQKETGRLCFQALAYVLDAARGAFQSRLLLKSQRLAQGSAITSPYTANALKKRYDRFSSGNPSGNLVRLDQTQKPNRFL
jgi:hypothetical protein